MVAPLLMLLLSLQDNNCTSYNLWRRMLANHEASQKLSVAEMIMLRWMCGETRKDRIRNEGFSKHLRITSIGDELRETRLRQFGHVQRRLAMMPMSKSFSM